MTFRNPLALLGLQRIYGDRDAMQLYHFDISAIAAVPEPRIAGLLLAAAVVLFSVRRKTRPRPKASRS